MMTRTALPNRRHAERIRFEHGEPGREQTFFGTLGYPDLSGEMPLEIFLAGGKPGSSLDAMTRDFAVVVSIALQSGVPLEDMRRPSRGLTTAPQLVRAGSCSTSSEAPMRDCQPWSAEDDALLNSLAGDGLSASQIATRMGRSRSSVIGRSHRIGGGVAGRSTASNGRAWTPRRCLSSILSTPECDCRAHRPHSASGVDETQPNWSAEIKAGRTPFAQTHTGDIRTGAV
jgi:hypothetical protein